MSAGLTWLASAPGGEASTDGRASSREPQHVLVVSSVDLQGELARTLDANGYLCEVTGTLRDALVLTRSLGTDVVLFDCDNTSEEPAELVKSFHPAPVILLATSPEMRTVLDAFRADVADILLKPVVTSEMLAALVRTSGRIATRRELWAAHEAVKTAGESLARLNGSAASAVAGGPPRTVSPLHDRSRALASFLTSREREVAVRIWKGQRVAEMAVSLKISENTVRAHLRSIFKKCGVRSQVEFLAKYAAGSS